jgi:hypothetical protein
MRKPIRLFELSSDSRMERFLLYIGALLLALWLIYHEPSKDTSND